MKCPSLKLPHHQNCDRGQTGGTRHSHLSWLQQKYLAFANVLETSDHGHTLLGPFQKGLARGPCKRGAPKQKLHGKSNSALVDYFWMWIFTKSPGWGTWDSTSWCFLFSNRPLNIQKKFFSLEIGVKNPCPDDNYISLHLCSGLQFARVHNAWFYFISTPALWARQGQYYSCLQIRKPALSLPGFFPSASQEEHLEQEVSRCDQGPLGTNPQACDCAGSGTSWP